MRASRRRCRPRSRRRGVEQRRVPAVRGAVGEAAAVVVRPVVGRAGRAGGLHRRQDSGTTAWAWRWGPTGRTHVRGLCEDATGRRRSPPGYGGTWWSGPADGSERGTLVTRGLPTDRTWRSVIDEATGLCRAITGCPPAALVQRCEPHELRNALGHLAEPLHVVLGKALRGCLEPGFSGPRGESAGAGPPGARRRPFGRVLEETLTVEGSVSRDRIERTLHTTNVIGNQMESVEGHTQRVKRWREANLIRRVGWRARWGGGRNRASGACGRYRDPRDLVGALSAFGTARRRGC